MTRKALIMGAAGRDFHNFNTYCRGNPNYKVVAFTAAQIPYIEKRTYPASLAGAEMYPRGIPIFGEERLVEVIKKYKVDEVFFSYSDASYENIMHIASKVIAAGASFVLLGTKDTQLKSRKPVISVLATRTGAGKSTIARMVLDAVRRRNLKAVIVRHPMPYGDLEAQAVQHFRSKEDFRKHKITIEEEEEYADHIERDTDVLAGVDYQRILRLAESMSDIIIWDGGNNDFSFYTSDHAITIVVADPLRAGDEARYHPSEVNVRTADAIVINKTNVATKDAIEKVIDSCRKINSTAKIFKVKSQETVDKPDLVKGKKVLVVEDGPSITHGQLSEGVGAIAARKLDCTLVDPRPFAVGSIKRAYDAYPWIGKVLPALGYSARQVKDLETSINAADCDTVVLGTPADLNARMRIRKPTVRVRFEGRDDGIPMFSQYMDKVIARISRQE